MRWGHKSGIRRAASVTFIVGMVAAIGPTARAAPAPADVRYVSASTKVGAQVDQHAACPAGTEVTGGGVKISGAGTSAPISVESSLPWDGPAPGFANGWLGVANDDALAQKQMTVVAICAASGSFSYVGEGQDFTGPGQLGLTAQCPAGTSVAGGGVDMQGQGTAFKLNSTLPKDGPDADSKPDDAWFGQGINEIPGFKVNMVVHAICAATGVFKVVSNSGPVNPASQGSAFVNCPSGTSVVGGGVSTSGTGNDDVVASSAPIDGPDADSKPDDGWNGYVANGEGGTETETTWAVCAMSGTYRYISATATLGTRVARKVSCPAGTSVTGGGVHVTDASSSPFLRVNTSEPLDGPDGDAKRDDGWMASASNRGDPTQTMTVYAICSTSGSFTYVTGPLLNLPAGGQKDAIANCPAGTKVTGGGVNVTGQSSLLEVSSLRPVDGPDDGFDFDDAWHARENNGTEAAQKVNAFAVCMAGGALTHAFSPPENLPLFSQASSKTPCPAGTSVLGGGIFIQGPIGETHLVIESTEPFDGPDGDTKRDDGWLAYALNETDTTQPMQSYAVCTA